MHQISLQKLCHVAKTGILVDEAEKKSIIADLAEKHVMILRNHGFVICGVTIEHAFLLAYHLILACETQIRCCPNGENQQVIRTSKEAQEQVEQVVKIGGGGVNRIDGKVDPKKWQIGELEWEAYMRNMDRNGYKTGHQYKNW
ncbi:unnamed protein product [Caenorhabditis angaria]|uniref:Class II aldolase/adducin N-terminal domain-containing protein n=1 Tax=Caenorhabditis angaria TaxID=860376 RepID=A0A9P1IS23_9PELO|nr:unnamed protein product [Caenorhabditis angaria]